MEQMEPRGAKRSNIYMTYICQRRGAYTAYQEPIGSLSEPIGAELSGVIRPHSLSGAY